MPRKISLKIQEKIQHIKGHNYKVDNKIFYSNKRIKMLFLIKNERYSYKKSLANELNVNRQTIEIWIKKYENGGINKLLELNNRSNANTVITDKIKKMVKRKLSDPYFRHKPFRELYEYVNSKNGNNIKYSTLHKFVRKHKMRNRKLY